MEFENDVKTVIAEMAEELNKNYSDQKLFDLSLGERLPQKDEIIDFVDELRKVTFPASLVERIWHMLIRNILQDISYRCYMISCSVRLR